MDLNKEVHNDLGLQFKPITKGLGFNKKENIPEFSEVKINKKELKPEKWMNAHNIQKNLQETVVNQPQKRITRKPLGMSATNTRSQPQISKPMEEASIESALNLFHKFFSWMIDTTLVLTVAMGSTLLVNYFFSKVFDWGVLFSIENWIYITGPLFGFYFVFYYSIFWKTTQRTLGMMFFNLKIKSNLGKSIHLKQTMFRSIIGLTSILTFGILDILGLPDALTWTSIQKLK